MRGVLFEITAEGVGDVRLGTELERVVALLEGWGVPRRFTRGRGLDQPHSDWMVRRQGTTAFVYCDAEGRVDAIEFATTGWGAPGSDQVVFDGVDVFIEPADAVLDRLRSKGHRVVVRGKGYDADLPEDQLAYLADNAAFFDEVLPGRDTPLGSPGGASALGRIGVDTPLVSALPLRS